MIRSTWAGRLATAGVAVVAIVSIVACRSARRGDAAETTGVRAAPAGSVGSRPVEARERSRMGPESEQQPDSSRARYPKAWEVEVPAGTRLDTLRREMDAQFPVLPPKDLEDQTPLPIWFRVYLRKKNPGLPAHGPYQYPRTATRLLQWMVAHPNSAEIPVPDSV